MQLKIINGEEMINLLMKVLNGFVKYMLLGLTLLNTYLTACYYYKGSYSKSAVHMAALIIIVLILDIRKKKFQNVFEGKNNGAVGNKPFDETDMLYIANRIDPAFYDIEIDGADDSKEDFLRQLKMIINDRINDRII